MLSDGLMEKLKTLASTESKAFGDPVLYCMLDAYEAALVRTQENQPAAFQTLVTINLDKAALKIAEELDHSLANDRPTELGYGELSSEVKAAVAQAREARAQEARRLQEQAYR